MAEGLPPNGPQAVASSDEIARSGCVSGEFADSVRSGFEELDEQRRKFADNKSAQKVFAQHVERRIAELEELNRRLSVRMSEEEERRQASKRQVGAIYANMKPAAAGEIIAAMDPGFAAGIFQIMPEESASPIFATLPPEKAYAITVLMTGSANR